MSNTVLFVDDDRELLLALREGLRRWANVFELRMAENGFEAIDYLRREEVSLVVTDLRMPQMGGLELLAAITQRYPDIPVIVMTGYGTPDEERLALRGGAVDFMAKPVALDHLVRRMIAILKRQKEGGTLHHVSCATFLQLIEMEQKTCTIRLQDGPSKRKGVLFFAQGELFDARLGNRQGVDAAHEILAWDHVSLSLQNQCPVRENRIHQNLNLLILEAARRSDENGPASTAGRFAGAESPAPGNTGRSSAFLRARVEKARNAGWGVKDVFEDPSWNLRVRRMDRHGERLKLGKLTLAYVNRGDARDCIIHPSEPAVVIAVDPKCPRDKLMQLLGG